MTTRRSRPGVLALAVSLVASVVGIVGLAATPAAAAPLAHRVLVVSDSVGLSAKTVLPTAFPADWEVNVIGTPAMFVEQLEASHVKPQIALRPWTIGDHVVVAGGYNYPYWDPGRFDRSVDSMIATLTAAGVKNIYWVTLREVKPQFVTPSAWRSIQPYYWYFPEVNQHLERALLRHPNLTLIDWAAVADRPGITYDAIHLNSTGAALYSNLIADAVHNANTRRPNGAVTRVAIPKGVAGDAVSVNLTATGTRRDGYFSAYPCDDPRPVVSNLNHGRDTTVAASAIVPVGPSREICVYNHQAGQVIVDLSGSFAPAADLADRVPTRLLDTRQAGNRRPQAAGATRVLRVIGGKGAPPGTRTVALSVTAVGATRTGYVSVHPCSVAAPTTSNLNFRPGRAVPNLVIAEPDADGDVCITTSAAVHLAVDLFASFGPSSDLGVVRPYRPLDSRTLGPTPAAGSVLRVRRPALAAARGAVPGASLFLNVTITGATMPGFATAYGCDDGRPATSNVNYTAGVTVANLVTVTPDADGDVCIYVHSAAHVVVDALGNTGSTFDDIAPRRLLDTRR